MEIVRDDNEKIESESAFDWIVGIWKNEGSDAFEEWEKSSNHLFIGTAYIEENGEKVVKEHIRLETINDRFFYIAEIPDTSIAVTFDVTHISDSGFVCESDEINFPKKIAYELNGFDILSTRLEGLGKNLSFALKKIS